MGKISNSVDSAVTKKINKPPSVAYLLNETLSKDMYQKRFNELLGNRSAQFVSSLVAVISGNDKLQQAFFESPNSVIQAGLKAANYDLPIDSSLGYAYIIPFGKKQSNGSYKQEAQFILGYKGMHQLAMRTGAYKTINVLEVRQGELLSYNRLSEDIEFNFIDDEDEREKLPVIGYAGYYKLINGMEKTIYMTKKQVELHEKKHRKGNYQNQNWRENFDTMALKTVYRNLIGKWGLMSIDYQNASPTAINSVNAINEDLQMDIIDEKVDVLENNTDTADTDNYDNEKWEEII